ALSGRPDGSAEDYRPKFAHPVTLATARQRSTILDCGPTGALDIYGADVDLTTRRQLTRWSAEMRRFGRRRLRIRSGTWGVRVGWLGLHRWDRGPGSAGGIVQ